MVAVSQGVPFVLNADWAILTATVGTVYALGLVVMARKGNAQPFGRVLAFYGGMVGVLAAFVSPLDNYDVVSMFAHTAQHLILMFVVAPLVALGAPITVLLASCPVPVRRRMVTALESGLLRLLTQPLVATALFIAAQALAVTRPFGDAALGTDSLHLVEHAMCLIAGFLFWWPILAVDPTPTKAPIRARYAALIAAVPLEIALAVALLVAGRPWYPHYASLPVPWGGHAALLSQRKAGVLLLLVPAFALIIPGLRLASESKNTKPAA